MFLAFSEYKYELFCHYWSFCFSIENFQNQINSNKKFCKIGLQNGLLDCCDKIIVTLFIYSEKATKFPEISTVDLYEVCSTGQIHGGDFAKFCGLLRIY